MPNFRLGRNVLGLAAITFGVISLTWHDFGAPWQQIQALGNFSHREILVYFAAVVEILGGIAIQWPRTARAGAIALGAIYSIFALLWIPRIIAEPHVYDPYGNFFEQFSMISGALTVYALADHRNWTQARRIARIGCICFAVCVVSFTLEQAFYLSATASFVPKWIPPGQMFWAVATTIFFALAAIALFTGRFALLASRLLTVMILSFQILIWIPAPFSDAHSLMNWAGNAENLGIAAAAWIVADFLSQDHSASNPVPARAAQAP